MPFVLNTTRPINVKRSDGRITRGFLQGSVKGRKDQVFIAWVDEQGCNVGKVVPINEFVEFNSTYAFLLPQPEVITITFSPEQIEAFKQCSDCPEFFKEL
jgi:hypothetical protein